MADKAAFLNKLHQILGIAKENGNRITMDEVRQSLAEDNLTEEQVAMTCEYLMSQKVVVVGYEASTSTAEQAKTQEDAEDDAEKIRLSEEEQTYLQEYLNDLGNMNPKDEASAKMAHYLPKVVELAVMLHVPDLFIGDMIQEGNISLMMALEDEQRSEEEILAEVRSGIRTYVEAHTEVKRQGNRMVEKVSQLDDFIKEMTEGLGRKVYMDEVAEKMGISEEEIEKILKLAGEEVPGDGGEEEDSSK